MSEISITDHLRNLDSFLETLIKLKRRFTSAQVRDKDVQRLALISKLCTTYENLKNNTELTLSKLLERKNNEPQETKNMQEEKEEVVILDLSDNEEEKLSDTEEVKTLRNRSRNLYKRNILNKMLVNHVMVEGEEEFIRDVIDFVEISNKIKNELREIEKNMPQ
jgi:hypothetical protein